MARGGAKLLQRNLGGQKFEVHFKSSPLPKVGVTQSNHLIVVYDLNFENYEACERRSEVTRESSP